MNAAPAIRVRLARLDDLVAIVAMLADDPIATRRERFEEPLPDSYRAAYDAIEHDPNNELLVAERDGQVVGVLQLTYIPGLTYQGGWRALVEAVRVETTSCGQGVGGVMMRWAIARAGERGCRIVQLTSDKRRHDALRFYERLGFRPTHNGFKLHLEVH